MKPPEKTNKFPITEPKEIEMYEFLAKNSK